MSITNVCFTILYPVPHNLMILIIKYLKGIVTFFYTCLKLQYFSKSRKCANFFELEIHTIFFISEI